MTTNRLAALAAVLLVPVLVVWWPGCRQYPAVTSKESLELMKLLYAACNAKDPARLAKVEKGLADLDRAGKLAPAEKAGFDGILATARAGDWQAAEDAAYKFAEDQVGRGHPDPHPHDHGKKAQPGPKR